MRRRYFIFSRIAVCVVTLLVSTKATFAAELLEGDPTKTIVSELAPGVFFRQAQTEPEFTGCNQGWVVFEDFVLIIDANFPGQANDVLAAIRETTDKPIRYVFDTHYHGDHADGNVRYVNEEGSIVVASERSQALFDTKGAAGFAGSQESKPDEYGHLKYEKPSLYFPRRLVIDDGEQRVELLHFGHAHTAGDAVAWVPKHGVLFTGDAVVNGPYNYTGDADTKSWITVLNALEELPIKTIGPGHGAVADKSLIAKQRRYFVELRGYVEKAIAAGKSLEVIKAEIELPFYEDWTGVDVKERTENIEKVYGELGGE